MNKKFKKDYFKPTQQYKVPKETVNMLKKAWKDLPDDFTVNEREIFIELAERLIKLNPKDEIVN